MNDNRLLKSRVTAEWVLAAAALLITVCAAAPYLIAARYSLPWGDDFCFYADTKAAAGGSYLVKCLVNTGANYVGWQGNYSTTFLLALLHPLQLESESSYAMLRLIMAGVLLGVLLGTALLSAALSRYMGVRRVNAVFFFFLMTVPLLLYREYKSVYLYYTVVMVYTLPLIFLELGLSFLFYGSCTGRRLFYWLSGLMMFMMSGGVLEAVGFGALIMLALCAVEYFRTGKPSKSFNIIFAVTLAGALINVLAPGNYVRHGGFGSDFSIIAVLANTFKAVWIELKWVFGETSFVCFPLLALLLGSRLRARLSLPLILTLAVGLLLLPLVTIFPVVLGYNWQGEAFPDRCIFLLDTSIFISCQGLALLLGTGLAPGHVRLGVRAAVSVAALVLLLSSALMSTPPQEYIPVRIAQNLRNGSIQEHSTVWREIYEDIRLRGEADTVITVPLPELVVGSFQSPLAAYPDHYVNNAIAECVGINSVVLNPPREVP